MFRKKRTPDPQERFVAAAAALVAGMDGVERVERIGDFEIVGHREGGHEPVRLHVANTWQEVRDRPVDEQDEVLRRLAANVVADELGSWEEIAPLLYPGVRTAGWVGAAGGVAHWDLAPLLGEILVVDEPERLSFLSVDRLRDLGITPADARAQARDNLLAAGLPLGALDGDLAGCFGVVGPEYLEASWLTMPDVIARITETVGDDPIVLAPTTRDVVAVSRHENDAVGRALAWALTSYQEQPRPLSPVPYAAAGDRLVPWTPPVGHPNRFAVELAAVHLTLGEYGEQTQGLRELFERTGEDVFVAEASGSETADGTGAFTWAVWPELVTDGLLPAVDRVAMFDAAEAVFYVAWDDVVELAGDHLVAESWQPPRWRVRAWPPPDVVEQLRARAVV